jgi:nucleotide-binding universal stress UspA family protein
MEREMEEALTSPLGSLRDIPHELLFDHGSICSRLLAAADRCGIDLIVIGTHGWHRIKKLLKGSTAEEIASFRTR